MQRSVKNALKQLAESAEPFDWLKTDVADKLTAAGYANLVNVQTPRPPHDSVPVRITMRGKTALKRGDDVTEDELAAGAVDNDTPIE